ncbi:hypothetical protein PAXRUDRAFT_156274, partial [Paxillus rubicundulus Ve08.2h10]
PNAPREDRHLQLLRAQLFPATISRPKTAFTFDVLDHFHIDNLECKTTVMSFFSKLIRFTPKGTPVPDCYRELMQITHLWQYLAFLRRSGVGHDSLASPKQSLFCPACPQPGVNLQADWEQIYPE